MARQAYEEQVMVACPGCGRTFSGQDRLSVHMRGCSVAKEMKTGSSRMRECMVPGGNGEVGSDDNGSARTPKAAPKMHMCYICGKEFGSTSLAIHEVQCLKKYQDQQALLAVEHRKAGVCVYVCVFMCVCLCGYVCVFAWLSVHLCACEWLCVCVCICVCVCLCGYVCM